MRSGWSSSHRYGSGREFTARHWPAAAGGNGCGFHKSPHIYWPCRPILISIDSLGSDGSIHGRRSSKGLRLRSSGNSRKCNQTEFYCECYFAHCVHLTLGCTDSDASCPDTSSVLVLINTYNITAYIPTFGLIPGTDKLSRERPWWGISSQTIGRSYIYGHMVKGRSPGSLISILLLGISWNQITYLGILADHGVCKPPIILEITCKGRRKDTFCNAKEKLSFLQWNLF